MNQTLITRGTTAAIFLGIMITGIYAHPLTLWLLFGTISVMCFFEYQKIMLHYTEQVENLKKELFLSSVFVAILYIGLTALLTLKIETKYAVLLLPLFFLLFIKSLFSTAKKPFIKLMIVLLGVVYITLPCSLVYAIACPNSYTFAPSSIMGIFFLISINDTAAYLVGSQIGKTPLFTRVSPKKTWEGTIAGIIACLALPLLLTPVLGVFTLSEWFQIGAVVAFTGTFGDLVESLLKRNAGIKDSGTLLPGHGGMLDRFDALIFTMPFVYALIVFQDFKY